jgi:hypothetical protein
MSKKYGTRDVQIQPASFAFTLLIGVVDDHAAIVQSLKALGFRSAPMARPLDRRRPVQPGAHPQDPVEPDLCRSYRP